MWNSGPTSSDIAGREAMAVASPARDAGGSARFATHPLERCFRDIRATTQHIGTGANTCEIAGRVLHGLDPGTPRV
jgi:alkylation response protein AidB-like acyl-CoA dehydrogenase